MIVQELIFYYYKDTRGAKYDSYRYNFTYELPYNIIKNKQNPSGEFYSSNQFRCDKNKMVEYIQTNPIDPKISNGEVIFKWGYIKPNGDVIFKYNSNMGLPEKYKVKEDFHSKVNVPFEEVAFNLKENEYGKIIYNGRILTFEQPYYIFVACNILNNSDAVDKNYFIDHKPVKTYKQISRMF